MEELSNFFYSFNFDHKKVKTTDKNAIHHAEEKQKRRFRRDRLKQEVLQWDSGHKLLRLYSHKMLKLYSYRLPWKNKNVKRRQTLYRLAITTFFERAK